VGGGESKGSTGGTNDEEEKKGIVETEDRADYHPKKESMCGFQGFIGEDQGKKDPKIMQRKVLRRYKFVRRKIV